MILNTMFVWYDINQVTYDARRRDGLLLCDINGKE